MNIQDEIQKIHHQYGTTEKANYEIQKLFDEELNKKYSEEDMINFAFDTYCYISELMDVEFNKISENKLHAMYNFEQFKKKVN